MIVTIADNGARFHGGQKYCQNMQLSFSTQSKNSRENTVSGHCTQSLPLVLHGRQQAPKRHVLDHCCWFVICKKQQVLEPRIRSLEKALGAPRSRSLKKAVCR